MGLIPKRVDDPNAASVLLSVIGSYDCENLTLD